MSAFDLSRLRRLLTAVGQEGDAASMAGSLHAKLESIYPFAASIPSGITNVVTGNASGGASGAYGAWTQLIASTAAQITVVDLIILDDNDQFSAGVLQLGTGGAGSEVGIHEQVTNMIATPPHPFPALVIAAGTRVAFRTKSVSGNNVDALLFYV